MFNIGLVGFLIKRLFFDTIVDSYVADLLV